MVAALVGADGIVRKTRIARGVPMLDEAAAACVREARFRPAIQQHRAVAAWVLVPIAFRLR